MWIQDARQIGGILVFEERGLKSSESGAAPAEVIQQACGAGPEPQSGIGGGFVGAGQLCHRRGEITGRSQPQDSGYG